MKVLVVDDSKAMRMIVLRSLRHSGVRVSQVMEAADGAAALQIIVDDPPDVVLADWNMPHMTGIELLRAVRHRNIDVAFGFVTTESTASLRLEALKAGAAFVITKPFSPQQLAEALEQL